jgi:hypothetical protein
VEDKQASSLFGVGPLWLLSLRRLVSMVVCSHGRVSLSLDVFMVLKMLVWYAKKLMPFSFTSPFPHEGDRPLQK